MSRRAGGRCEGQYVLPEFEPAAAPAWRECVHRVDRLLYVDAAQTAVACVECGEVVAVPDLPIGVRSRLR